MYVAYTFSKNILSQSQSFRPRHEKTYLKPYANNRDADQPAQIVYYIICMWYILAKAKISRLYLASVAE